MKLGFKKMLIMLGLVSTLMAPMAAYAADTYEPNDSPLSAYAIAYNTTYNSYIWTTSDTDYYVVPISFAGGHYVVTVTPPIGKNYDVYVYNSSMSLVGTANSNGAGVAEAAVFLASTTGNYIIKVVSHGGVNDYSQASTYSLIVQ